MREIAKSSADSLLSLINQILDFSKIEAGKLELEATEFDLRVVVEDTVEMFVGRAQTKAAGAGLPDQSRGARGPGGRSRPLPPDRDQPDQQRHQVHRTRARSSCASRSNARRPDGAVVRLSRHRHGHRHSRGSTQPAVSARSRRSTSRPRASTAAPGLGLAITKTLVELMEARSASRASSARARRSGARCRSASMPSGADRRAADSARPAASCASWHWTTMPRTWRFCSEQFASWGLELTTVSDGPTALEVLRERGRHRPARSTWRFSTCRCPAWTAFKSPHAIKPRPGHARHAADRADLDGPGTFGRRSEPAIWAWPAYVHKPVRQSRLLDAIVNAHRSAVAGSNKRRRAEPIASGAVHTAPPARPHAGGRGQRSQPDRGRRDSGPRRLRLPDRGQRSRGGRAGAQRRI